MTSRGYTEKRRARRGTLERPLPAYVAGMSAHLLDLSSAGARVEHDVPLGIRREMRLRFEWEGATVVVTCVVVRCRLQRSHTSPGAASYVSGLRFTAPDEPARGTVRAIVASLLGASHGESSPRPFALPGV